MTPILLSALLLIIFYGIYFAARTARVQNVPSDFLDGGYNIPGALIMLILPGLILSGIGLHRHLSLISIYGLQASHIAIGLVPVSICALLVWNRMWFVTRIANLPTPGEALGQYYQSITLRVLFLALALIFALPFAANIMSYAASELEIITGHLIPRAVGVWILSASIAISAIIGGWRAMIYMIAMLSVLLLLFLPAITLFIELTADTPTFPIVNNEASKGILIDRLPGVLQYVAGVGKNTPSGGIFTAVGVASHILAILGVVICPGALYLAQTSQQTKTVGISTIWLTSGVLAGTLLVDGPILASRLTDGSNALIKWLYIIEPLAAVMLAVMIIAGAMLSVYFFVTSGALLITREAIIRYLLPDLSPRAQRLAARIALGVGFFLMAFLASFTPYISAIIASTALPFAVQLLPAIIGLTFIRSISCGAILAGITLGSLIVIFTEPLGLILFEALFVDLPWGRWPLTIHSAAWGLVFNFLLVFLASAATLKSPDYYFRDRLHNALDQIKLTNSRGAGSLGGIFILWSFLAYGPGAVLGNTFFDNPIFTDLTPILNIPSLWVWQILFWLIGVLLIWFMAYLTGFNRTSEKLVKPINFGDTQRRKTPDWLLTSLNRLR